MNRFLILVLLLGTAQLTLAYSTSSRWGFSPKGGVMAYTSGTMLQLFNTSSGELVYSNNDHEKVINSIAFSRDGKYIGFCSGKAKELTIIEIETGSKVFVSRGDYDAIVHINDLSTVVVMIRQNVGKNQWEQEVGIVNTLGDREFNHLFTSNWKSNCVIKDGKANYYNGASSEGTLVSVDLETMEVLKERSFKAPFTMQYYLDQMQLISVNCPSSTGCYTKQLISINEDDSSPEIEQPSSKKNNLYRRTGLLPNGSIYRISNKGELIYVNKNFERIEEKGTIEKVPEGREVQEFQDSLLLFDPVKNIISKVNLSSKEITKCKIKPADAAKYPQRGPKVVKSYASFNRYYILYMVKDKIVHSTAVICCSGSLDFGSKYDLAWMKANNFYFILGDSPAEVQNDYRDLVLYRYPTSQGYQYSTGEWKGIPFKCKYGCE